jgi:hypothetical protein
VLCAVLLPGGAVEAVGNQKDDRERHDPPCGSAGAADRKGQTRCDDDTDGDPPVVADELYRVVKGQTVLVGVSPEPVDYGVPMIGRSADGGTWIPGTFYAVSKPQRHARKLSWSGSASHQREVSCAFLQTATPRA